jgi:hypothetical protein
MNSKVKSCFEPHVLMHALFGLGLGLFIVSFVPMLANLWIGIGLMVIAFVLDMMRKK